MANKYKDINDFGEKLGKAVKVSGGDVPLDTLFNQGFLVKHSSVKTIDELFSKAGIKIESADDFKALPEERLNNVIKEHTNFNTWEEILRAAGEEYMANEIKKRLR